MAGMSDSEGMLERLDQAVSVLHQEWGDSLPGGAIGGGVDVGMMSDVGLVRVTDAIACLRRQADALMVQAAAEVARRSPQEFGASGLAKSHGFQNATRFIAAATLGPQREAAKLIAVGKAIAERISL